MPIGKVALTDELTACGAGKPKRRRQSNPLTRDLELTHNANVEGAGKSFPCPPEAKNPERFR